MDKHILKEICLKQMGATYDYKVEWEAERYLIGGKMFAMFGSDSEEKPILTLKCDPERADHLRETYKGIISGYYMNKKHWNSLYLEANIPDELFEPLIRHSYELVFQTLTKKVQAEIVLRLNT